MLGFSIITVCFEPHKDPSHCSLPRALSSELCSEFCIRRGTKWTRKIYSEICCMQNTGTCICKFTFAYSKFLQTWFILACYGCTCKFPSSSTNYLFPHNRYIPFPKTTHFRPYITLVSCKSINTATSPYRNVFALLFLWILLILCWSLFSFLYLQLPFCPDPAFALTMKR